MRDLGVGVGGWEEAARSAHGFKENAVRQRLLHQPLTPIPNPQFFRSDL